MAGCRCSQGSKGRPGLTRPLLGYSCCNRQRSEAGAGSQSSGEPRAESRQTLSYLADILLNHRMTILGQNQPRYIQLVRARVGREREPMLKCRLLNGLNLTDSCSSI